ncbi:MAG: carboxypeptidase-like regulatory domain-containing protein [bacterium]|nr:carboxypeptidase-like regulatory domain-containing protein [bacterium]MDT8365951.1 carboxypeptidase-like regulatory domain-containing protein [bacterium]
MRSEIKKVTGSGLPAPGFWVGFLCLILASPPSTLAGSDSGIYGRVAYRGELVPGVIVSAYSDGDSEYLANPVAVSDPVATDGTYRLSLPPGQYTLVARSSASGNLRPDARPDTGDYYCYYSGSPVIVIAGSWTPVGFNLVKTAVEERIPDSKTSIEGIVSYRDEPLEKLYLTLYDEALEGFRGPGMATIPVGKGGRFRVSVKPGKYFVIARKRNRGGMYGPMEIGDYFNYYPGNPVMVSDGEKVRIRLETVTRVSQLEEGEAPTPTIQGTVVDADGNPVPGLRVFAYRSGEVTGRPLYFSKPSNSTGQYSLLVPVSGDFTLVAKERFGGPAAEGEFTGRTDDLHLPPERGMEKIVIVVKKEILP